MEVINNEEFEGLDQYNCSDSEDVLVGDLLFYGNFYPMSFPSGFTPNFDGINDEWIVGSADVQQTGLPDFTGAYNATHYKLAVLDRWGQATIYEGDIIGASRPEGFKQDEIRWDGRFNDGSYIDPGLYVFVLKVGNCSHPLDVNDGNCIEPQGPNDPNPTWAYLSGNEKCIKGFVHIGQ